MPFNGSGTFSIINTFVPNTTILSAAVNQNYTDIATGLSDCLTRDGQAGMTAVLKAISGSVSAPGISFNSDATSGMYLLSTGRLGVVAKSLGLFINSTIFQVSAAAVVAGGSGYAVGDVIEPAGGTPCGSMRAYLTVATLSGSAVATVTVTYPGNYFTAPTNPVSQNSTDGSGTGATFNLTTTAQFATSLVTDEGGNPVWPRLGSSSFVSGLMRSANAYDLLKALGTFSSGFSINRTTSPPTITTTLNPTLVPNYISGLTLSTAGSSATMSIAAGVASDSTNTVLMNLASAISKTTASWAVGTGNGGLDTGAIAGSTWYHFYEIERVDTGVVDVVFSTSASAPTLPTNYTIYRRIGSGKTDGSNHWLLFTQTGNNFVWSASSADVSNAAATSASRTGYTLGGVPLGVVVMAQFRVNFQQGVAAYYNVTSLQEADVATGGTAPADVRINTASAIAGWFSRLTNTAQQIGIRSDTASSTGMYIFTYGWTDYRGQS